MLMILSLKLRNPRAAWKIFGEGVGAKMWTWMKLSWFSSAEEFSAQSHPLRHYFFKSHFRIKIWHKFLTLTEEVTNDGRTRRNLENNSFVWNFRLNFVQKLKVLELYHWKLLPLNAYYYINLELYYIRVKTTRAPQVWQSELGRKFLWAGPSFANIPLSLIHFSFNPDFATLSFNTKYGRFEGTGTARSGPKICNPNREVKKETAWHRNRD